MNKDNQQCLRRKTTKRSAHREWNHVGLTAPKMGWELRTEIPARYGLLYLAELPPKCIFRRLTGRRCATFNMFSLMEKPFFMKKNAICTPKWNACQVTFWAFI